MTSLPGPSLCLWWLRSLQWGPGDRLLYSGSQTLPGWQQGSKKPFLWPAGTCRSGTETQTGGDRRGTLQYRSRSQGRWAGGDSPIRSTLHWAGRGGRCAARRPWRFTEDHRTWARGGSPEGGAARSMVCVAHLQQTDNTPSINAALCLWKHSTKPWTSVHTDHFI